MCVSTLSKMVTQKTILSQKLSNQPQCKKQTQHSSLYKAALNLRAAFFIPTLQTIRLKPFPIAPQHPSKPLHRHWHDQTTLHFHLHLSTNTQHAKLLHHHYISTSKARLYKPSELPRVLLGSHPSLHAHSQGSCLHEERDRIHRQIPSHHV